MFLLLFSPNSILTQQQNKPQIQLNEVRFNILDTMFPHEDFQEQINNAIETTTNLFGESTFQFHYKFASAILACSEKYLNFVGALTPVVLDVFADKNVNMGPIVKVIEKEEIQREFKNGLIVKSIIISKTFNALDKIKMYPSRFCSQMENAHRELYQIVLELTSPKLNYRRFPSVISQIMLTITPVSSIIARSIPYLELESDMNCRLKDFFNDNFKSLLFDRLKKIDVIPKENFLNFHKLASSTLKNDLNKIIAKPKKNFGSGDTITIHDNLEFIKGTQYTGSMICGQDYFNFVRYRLESQFSSAINMLDVTCNNTRKKTGSGILTIY